MKPGARVRLLGDPGRVGVVGDRTRERGGLVCWKVVFPDGTSYVPVDQMVPVDSADDPIELLLGGRFGRAVDLRRLLTHVRLTGRLANLIYSLDATGTDFYAYQFKPVLKMLESVSGGMLIADEVGLGKTIEAGLVWTELRARLDLNRLVVVCPAMLREKWCNELSIRFGVDAQVVGASELAQFLQGRPSGRRGWGFAVVASLQGLRRRRGCQDRDDVAEGADELAQLLENEKGSDLIDLLVVDEAHYLRNPETASWRIGQSLREVSQYVLLLSATPINLKNRDLFQLLHLADEDTFTDADQFEQLVRANWHLVAAKEQVLAGRATPRSVAEQLEHAMMHPLLQDSRQIPMILSDLNAGSQLTDVNSRSALAYRLERANLLAHVVNRTRKRDVTEWRVTREAIPEYVPMTNAERDFYESVTGVVRRYAGRVAAHEGFLLATPQRQMASSMAAALEDWQKRGRLSFDSDLEVDEEETEGVGPLVSEIIDHVKQLSGLSDLRASDSKYEKLRATLKRAIRADKAVKIVLFSYFRATLHYLHERLQRDGFHTFLIHGQRRGGQQENLATISRFKEAAPPAILLSSEIGSEGLDLQFARILINYDLPWNPMKVEQRIGRLDRLGQEAKKITIWNLMHADTIDSRIYERLLQRLHIFETALGGLEPIIGDRIRSLTLELLRNDLTPEQEEARIEQTAQALENARQEEENLEEEAPQLVAYGDFILQQVNAARELSRRVDGSDLLNYVRDFLAAQYPGCELRWDADSADVVHITLTTDAKRALQSFLRDKQLPPTALGAAGSGSVPCRFVNNTSLAAGRRFEVVNQFHPLIRFVNFKTRQSGGDFYKVVAVQLTRDAVGARFRPGQYSFAVQRWSVSGVKDIEKLAFAAEHLNDGGGELPGDLAELLVTAAAARGTDWLTAAADCDIETAVDSIEGRCQPSLDSGFESFIAEVDALNHDRAEVQLRTLESRHQRQLASIEARLHGLRTSGRERLVPATLGQISKLKQRTEMSRRNIEERRSILHRPDEVCIGLINVTE